MSKKFAACIYLSENKAVKGLTDSSILSTDPVALAADYAKAEADSLILFDLSYNDATHDEAILMMKKLQKVSAFRFMVPEISNGWRMSKKSSMPAAKKQF